MINKKEFFQLGFIILFCFLMFMFLATLTIYLDNPFGFSFHPEFFQGLLFGIVLLGCLYLGWVKKNE